MGLEFEEFLNRLFGLNDLIEISNFFSSFYEIMPHDSSMLSCSIEAKDNIHCNVSITLNLFVQSDVSFCIPEMTSTYLIDFFTT